MSLFYRSDLHLEHLIRTWIIIMLAVAMICFIISELTRNYSQVDKLWSIMPIIYSLLTVIAYPAPRLWIMCCLVIIWGSRLTFNLYRKGGYNKIPWKGEEDYRWKIIRSNPVLKGRIRFGLFNLFFISFYQNLIILLFSTPLLFAAKYGNSSLSPIDIIAGSLIMMFIVIEAISDNQQYRFQKLKRQNDQSEKLYTRSLNQGFLSEGLWQFVRHPNYVSEQAIWISFSLFSVAASGKWINVTLSGSLLLVLLFLGSTQLTESISSTKYPGYEAYKKVVPKYFPRLRLNAG